MSQRPQLTMGKTKQLTMTAPDSAVKKNVILTLQRQAQTMKAAAPSVDCYLEYYPWLDLVQYYLHNP